MHVFPAIFERVAENLLSVDGSATQLPAILLAILIDVDAPLAVLPTRFNVLTFQLPILKVFLGVKKNGFCDTFRRLDSGGFLHVPSYGQVPSSGSLHWESYMSHLNILCCE